MGRRARRSAGSRSSCPSTSSRACRTRRTTIVARTAVLLPDAATIDATLTPEVRYRSLFPVIVYRSTVRLTGRFAPADLFAGLRVTPTAVHWDRARVIVSLSDMRGAVAVSPLTFGGRDQPLEPATDAASPFRGALQAPVTVDPEAVTPFAVEMTLAGTGALRFLPIGKATEVHLQSPWRHPGFAGAFLPESRTVTDAGFDARWRVTYLARSFPHAWLYEATARDERRQQLDATEFGVDFVQPVDQYQQTWRATKYGLLFILLTFAVVLLWEVRHALSLHPLQYLMVGCALVVFYLLLLSLSEHLGFAWAYGLAAAATVGLVTAYAARILASGLRGGGVMAGWLGTLYGFLYTLLQLEDLALLLGSIAVFLMLAALMYFTRRIDWYTMSHEPGCPGVSAGSVRAISEAAWSGACARGPPPAPRRPPARPARARGGRRRHRRPLRRSARARSARAASPAPSRGAR